jgi:hypothetical protein
MTREEIVKSYEKQLEEATTPIEKSTIKYELKKHLEAYDNGEEYNKAIPEPITCIGCGS